MTFSHDRTSQAGALLTITVTPISNRPGADGGGSLHADLFGWGTRIERERRIRVRLCVAAYAYEVMDQPLLTDSEYDRLAYTSDPTIQTGHLDDWWAGAFEPHTGQWIHTHPELTLVERCYRRLLYRR